MSSDQLSPPFTEAAPERPGLAPPNRTRESVQPAVASQGTLFRQLRTRALRNNLRLVWGRSSLRLLTILGCSLVIWLVVYGASAEGFYLFRVNGIPPGGAIVGTLFDLLFLTLAMLLIVSGGIILYSSLFSSAEANFLLSSAVRADQVFAYKYQGAIAFSSWGFILLASPVLVAYGFGYGAPWYFYLVLPLFVLGFVLLPGSLGALLCFLFVNYLPRRPKQLMIVSGLAFVALVGVWAYSLVPSEWHMAMNRDYVQRLVGQIGIAQGPLSPNHWMTRGLQAAARGELDVTAYNLALVWSNGLFLYVLTAWVARRLYRRGFNRMATGGMFRRRYGGSWMDNGLSRLVGFLDPQTRLLIVKDFRTFRRDPAQWTQVLIYVGLMLLYFTNIRSFYQQDDLSIVYQNSVSLMNVATTGILLCAYTGRFIYPMLSLEGRKFWILGLFPLERDRLILGKFAFSATWCLLISEVLIVFSDVMLGMPWLVVCLHALTVAVLSLGLSGISVGMGAWIPNFRETDPSKIAVGFGGSLNLVTGLLFLVVVTLLMAVPIHAALLTESVINPIYLKIATWLGLGGGVALGAAAVWFPLRIGTQALRRMEF